MQGGACWWPSQFPDIACRRRGDATDLSEPGIPCMMAELSEMRIIQRKSAESPCHRLAQFWACYAIHPGSSLHEYADEQANQLGIFHLKREGRRALWQHL